MAKSKAGIAIKEVFLQVTSHKHFMDIPDILTGCDQNILIMVEGHQLYCWSCGPTGNLSKACHGKNPAPPIQQPTTLKKAVGPHPKGLSEWQQVAKKGQKAVSPPPQQDVSQGQKQHQQQQQQKQGLKQQQQWQQHQQQEQQWQQ